MKQFSSIIFGLVLVSAGFMIQGHTPRGGDHYRIFVNDRLVLEQFVTMPVEKKSLSLAAFSESDKMVIHYSHCGKVGKERVISVKDREGKILKQWKFPDSRQSGMQLVIKDVMQAARKNSSAGLYYSSKELFPGLLLTNVNAGSSKTAKL